MRILVLANRVGHEIQRLVVQSGDTLEIQKKQFGELLRRKVEERQIQFIGEEASHKWGTTTARTLGVRWENIDMPMEERERRGILEEQQQRNRVPNAGTQLSADCRAAGNIEFCKVCALLWAKCGPASWERCERMLAGFCGREPVCDEEASALSRQRLRPSPCLLEASRQSVEVPNCLVVGLEGCDRGVRSDELP